MSGWITAGIGAAGAVGGGLLNLSAQQQASGNQQGSLQMAMQNYMLQKQMADQQYELSTASSTDARGNKTHYVPGQGWVTDVTPGTRSLINESDAISGMRGRRELTTGADDYSRNFNRRLTEGSTANPLLDAMRYGYGAPTREGVVGADKISGVTNASEGADQARSGFNAAALRTGMGSVPLGPSMASLDKGATQGIRSSLARSNANASPLYEGMLSQFNEGKLNPYNMLATRASNPEGSGFAPENISNTLDSGLINKNAIGASTAGRGATGLNAAISPLIASMIGQRTPNYDTFALGLSQNLKQFAPLIMGKGNTTDPRNVYSGDYSGGI